MNIFERALFPALKTALSDQRMVVITGMRRVGKTTTLHWLLDQIPSTNKHFFDLERLDLRSVFQESNYDLILNYFRNLGLDSSQPLTIAIDEIQNVPNLPSVVKYLYDHYRIKFLLSGSSSYYLKNQFIESMSGRKQMFEMFPLGFGEFLTFRGIPFRQRTLMKERLFDSHEYERLKGYYNEFVAFGGLPGVVLEPKAETKLEILKDIFTSYVNIDVQAMADFRKIGELQQLLKILVMRIGNRLDYSKLSKIVGISRPTLNEYLEFLEKTYIIHQLPAYARPDRSVSLGKKLYFRDNGIARVLTHPGDGALFENAIFNQLWASEELSYLAKGSEYEVDFIVTPEQGSPIALEVKYHPTQSDASRLHRIASQNGIHQSWLIGREPIPGFESFIWGGLIF